MDKKRFFNWTFSVTDVEFDEYSFGGLGKSSEFY